MKQKSVALIHKYECYWRASSEIQSQFGIALNGKKCLQCLYETRVQPEADRDLGLVPVERVAVCW